MGLFGSGPEHDYDRERGNAAKTSGSCLVGAKTGKSQFGGSWRQLKARYEDKV